MARYSQMARQALEQKTGMSFKDQMADLTAKKAGFKSVSDQQLNRLMRNQLEERAARLGISNQQAYAAAGSDLTNTQALQEAWNKLAVPTQQAPAQPAAQPLYGKQYSYTDPGDKGYFGMADYRELQNQGASRADMIRYAFSAPKGVGNKVAEQLGIRAFDAPIPSSLSYTDPGDKGFFGMKDFEELSRQGATLQQIKDYASKAKYGVGGEAASILGMRAATEGSIARAQADKDAAALEDKRIQAEKAAALQRATAAANMARAGQTPNLQIQPASGTSRTAGTQSFRRQRGPAILAGISSVLNI